MSQAAILQAVSLTGAVLVLLGFGGQQFAGMKSDGLLYGTLNFAGSLFLAASALSPVNAGVILLESVWALISLNVMVKALLRRGTKPGGGDPDSG